MKNQRILFTLAFSAAIAAAQSAGSFTNLTASGTTTLTANATPGTTGGSGSFRLGGITGLSIEMGNGQIQGYQSNNTGRLNLNLQGGPIKMLSGNGLYMDPIHGPKGGICMEVGTSPMGWCSGGYYNFRVTGVAMVDGSLNVTGNDTIGGNLKVAGSIYVGTTGWSISAPDYVFAPDYKLLPLNDVETYVKANRHLPGVESAGDLEKKGSADLVKLNMVLLQKVEELTLYTIELNKQVQALKAGNRN